jgi:hypothetical protein
MRESLYTVWREDGDAEAPENNKVPYPKSGNTPFLRSQLSVKTGYGRSSVDIRPKTACGAG